MASPCEVLIDTQDPLVAQSIAEIARKEALRIEYKFSRYRDDNIIYTINNAQGHSVELDQETARLIDYAAQCYQLSGGRFDITSGVLRRLWNFNGGDQVPSRKAAKQLLPLVGWDKAQWLKPNLRLNQNMEIDLGGLGKEYAVDRTAQLIQEHYPTTAVLVNYGGDLYATAAPHDKKFWQIGVESVGGGIPALISLNQGALTTSGDARRYLLRDGVRYPHILNPRTGWPVMNASNSITVAAPSCIEAGFLSTVALLYGSDARSFLSAQGVRYWIS